MLSVGSWCTSEVTVELVIHQYPRRVRGRIRKHTTGVPHLAVLLVLATVPPFEKQTPTLIRLRNRVVLVSKTELSQGLDGVWTEAAIVRDSHIAQNQRPPRGSMFAPAVCHPLDTRTDLGKRRGLFKDVDLESCFTEHDGGGDATEATSDDDDVEG